MEEFMWKGQCADKYHAVLFDHHTLDIQCTCLLFEFRGILCRHCLVVYVQEGVKSVPDKYVLKRWSKLQRRRHTYIRVGSNSDKEEANVRRYDALCKRFYEIAEVACESDNETHCLFKKLDSIANDHGLSSSDNPNKGVQLDTANDCPIQTVSSNECVHNPISIKRKGRPRSTRLKSIVEKLGKRRKATGAKIKG
ncbi:protein FAR1-RELATED SEQUENCE 1-like [Vigna unguiculata]|uniref:protein FAR1-RELATED SEQUENCE 1-like n=1 Tax=Vigna unguiculata TaxID=3917 RepID=UPI00101606AA|nr:protein FAR1-RELATED SEQUENCE 1-like [Vigna unguiculata]